MIWELTAGERGYLTMLTMMQKVYRERFPVVSNDNTRTNATSETDREALYQALFSGLSELTMEHARILQGLLTLHNENGDHIVENLGPCLLRLLDDQTVDSLSKLYGNFMFAHDRLRELIKRCKRQPSVAQFLEDSKNDPRMSRRSPEDCVMVVVQRWTKVEVLVQAIRGKTLNRPTEADALDKVQERVRRLLKTAEHLMVERKHAEKLRVFHDSLVIPEKGTAEEDIAVYERLRMEMQAKSTKLINHAPLVVFPSGVSTSQSVNVTGIALNTCFFLLEKVQNSSNYVLYRAGNLPLVIWWTRNYGYFRESREKSSFAFFMILPAKEALTLFRCQTPDELTRWQTVMTEGFAKYRSDDYVDMTVLKDDLQTRRSIVLRQWANTVKGLDLLSVMDNSLFNAYTARNLACSAVVKERLALEQSLKELSKYASGASKQATKMSEITQQSQPSSPASSIGVDNQLSPVVSTEHMADIQPNFITGNPLHQQANHLFALFQEYLKCTARALLGQTIPKVTRSTSDIHDPKPKKKEEPVRKTRTFGAADLENAKGERKFLPKKGSRQLMPALQDDLLASSATFRTAEEMEACDLPDDLVDNVNRLSQRLTNKNKMEQVLTYLDALYTTSLELCVVVCETQAKSTEMAASVEHLTANLNTAQITLSQILNEGGQLPATNQSDNPSSTNEVSLPANDFTPTTLKQETEKLRQEYENFTRKSTEWEKKRRQQEDAIERKQEALAKTKLKLADERAELMKMQARYEEDRKTLQEQINLHANMYSNVETFKLPEVQFDEPVDYMKGRSSIYQPQNPPRRNQESVSFYGGNGSSSDTDRIAVEPLTPGHSRASSGKSLSTFPDHISGSLLNEPTGSDRQDRLSTTNFGNSESSLMRLAEASKPHKSKTPRLFRKN